MPKFAKISFSWHRQREKGSDRGPPKAIWEFYRILTIASWALEQASRQGGLDRPYQDHLGGLDKAYKWTL